MPIPIIANAQIVKNPIMVDKDKSIFALSDVTK
jgi:hypothetical protein